MDLEASRTHTRTRRPTWQPSIGSCSSWTDRAQSDSKCPTWPLWHSRESIQRRRKKSTSSPLRSPRRDCVPTRAPDKPRERRAADNRRRLPTAKRLGRAEEEEEEEVLGERLRGRVQTDRTAKRS